MFNIGYRTLKTAFGTALAVWIAYWLGLDFYSSAGIITILCIQKTKRQSLNISRQRLLASTVGLLFGFITFELIGYHPMAIAVLLLIFIPVVVKLKAQAGIATSSVVMLHIFVVGEVSLHLFINELSLVIIGVGMALLMNTYMPSVEKELKTIQKQLEDNFKIIFKQFSSYLKEGDHCWDGREILETEKLLIKGKDIALQNIENQIFRYDDHYYHYFKMREKQFDLIERMLSIISTLDDTVVQGKKIAYYLDELSEGVTPGISTIDFLERLDQLKNEFKQMELPKDRREFEIRSALYSLMKEIEQYLVIKRQFRTKHLQG